MILVSHAEQDKDVSASGWDIYDTFASQRRRSLRLSHLVPGRPSHIYNVHIVKGVLRRLGSAIARGYPIAMAP